MSVNSDLQSAKGSFVRLRKFVNRDFEYEQFDRIVNKPMEDREKTILAFQGPEGMGKTMLLQRLQFECKNRNIANVRIFLEDVHNPVEIMRKIAKELGEVEFAKWFEKMAYWDLPAPVEVNVSAPAGTINLQGDGFQVEGDIIAGSKIEKVEVINTTNAALNPKGAESALTDTFLQSLGEFISTRSVVIILDGFDSTDSDTRRWLAENVLGRTRDLPGLGVLPVLGALSQPKFADSSLTDGMDKFVLKPLSHEHIIEYLKRIREIQETPEEFIKETAETCLNQSEGIPSRVSAFVDVLLEALKRKN